MKKKNTLLLLVGAAIGAGLTWLFTSDEGKELVNKMKDKVADLKDELEKKTSGIFEDTKNKV